MRSLMDPDQSRLISPTAFLHRLAVVEDGVAMGVTDPPTSQTKQSGPLCSKRRM